ncbi:hypothetical protein [Marinococcus luteus]|uniref:hypothetical protein n=1 Tax=Marinococcus luteus TaxID=1122204 RepID=UPI002ACCF979|nr:hypothetical protein [Marinococcus luteus]MDZ5781887.1 hypothetical protein [Marinococcus luteus]
MDLNEWKYRSSSKGMINLEEWMKFSILLARYLKQTDKCLKIYISVPSNLLFSYFFVLGAIDHDFKSPSKEKLLDQYLNLKKGQRILYKSGEYWKSHSVLELTTVPNTTIRAIAVKGRNGCTTYIPETRWFEYVRIFDHKISELKNDRKMQKIINITDDEKLKNLYFKENLNLLMSQNIPKTYLYTNKKEWKECSSIVKLEIEKERVNLEDLIYENNNNTFKNLEFIDQNQHAVTYGDSTIVFVGSSKALKKMDYFKQKKCIFIADQHESDENYETLKVKVEEEFLTGEGNSHNRKIIEYVDNNEGQIPKGVEVFAWVPES